MNEYEKKSCNFLWKHQERKGLHILDKNHQMGRFL